MAFPQPLPPGGPNCPSCGSVGLEVSQQRLYYPHGLLNSRSMVPTVTPDHEITTTYQCPCGTEWETQEWSRNPGSRMLKSVSRQTPTYSSGGYVAPGLYPTFQSHSWSPEPEPPAEPKETEPPPVIHGSVIGYRAWRLLDWQLIGSFSMVPWVPGVNEAVCEPPEEAFPYTLLHSGPWPGQKPPRRHQAPAIGCACGITALARFTPYDNHWRADCDIRGAIEAWSDEDEHGDGRFILHGNGFRAQFAKIVLLAIDDDWPTAKRAAVRALAKEHGADVCRHAHLEDAAKEHGQLVPDDMLGWAKEGGTGDIALRYSTVSWPKLLANQMAYLGISAQQAQAAGKMAPATTAAAKTAKPKKGVRQTLGQPGPPQGRLTKYAKGDRVRDSRGDVWVNVKAGKPGLWEREA